MRSPETSRVLETPSPPPSSSASRGASTFRRRSTKAAGPERRWRSSAGPGRRSARQHGDALDLDLRARYRQLADLDQRARRPRVAEDLLTDRIDLRPVVDVGEKDRH